MRKLFLILLILLSCCFKIYTIENAATCSMEDISAAITLADPGEDVVIPIGDCTWDGVLNITKQIGLIGSGTAVEGCTGANCTIIRRSSGYNGYLITLNPATDIDQRISNIYFANAGDVSGDRTAINVAGGTVGLSKIRIDHNVIKGGQRTIYVRSYVDEALIDSNWFINGTIAIYGNCDGDAAWGREIAAGTQHAVFVDNNNFLYNADRLTDGDGWIYLEDGCRFVTRYNNFDGTLYIGNSLFFDAHGNSGSHGTPTDAARAAPLIEIYNNKFDAHVTYRYIYIRGGSLLIHDNAFTAIDSSAGYISLTEEESWTSGGPFAVKPEALRWPAWDQINNSFFWNNTYNGSLILDITRQTTTDIPYIIKDRDYFMHIPTANGGSESYPTVPGGNDMVFTAEGANAYYPYTAYTCPHPLATELSGKTCASATAGSTGYGIDAGSAWTATPSISGVGCSISPVVPTSVDDGETAVFTITVQDAYRLVSVGGTCGGTGTTTYTTSAVTADCTVVATCQVQNNFPGVR
jgi:hypothetical protein